jgi:thioredoxin 1
MKDTKTLQYFTAAWCGPCRMFRPVVEKVERDAGINVQYIDVDEHPELAARYDILSVPTCIITKDGKDVLRFFGYKDQSTLLELYNSV